MQIKKVCRLCGSNYQGRRWNRYTGWLVEKKWIMKGKKVDERKWILNFGRRGDDVVFSYLIIWCEMVCEFCLNYCLQGEGSCYYYYHGTLPVSILVDGHVNTMSCKSCNPECTEWGSCKATRVCYWTMESPRTRKQSHVKFVRAREFHTVRFKTIHLIG